MEKKNTFYVAVIAILLVAVVAMSIGFAFSDVNLTITGGVTAKATKWDVHFKEVKNINNNGATVTTAPSVPANGSTSISYTVTLNKPGDYYEFDADVINAGDFNAILKTIALTSTSNIDYLDHVVTYNSTDYTAATNTITGNSALAPEGTETIHVKVSYVEPANESSLPETDQTQTLTVTLTYGQAQA